MYSEASFKNALKNEEAKKKAAKKDKAEDEDEAEDKELTDEEKDALDYQLQRGMDMVRAMHKMGIRPAALVCDGAGDAASEKSEPKDVKEPKANKSDKK